MRIRALAMIGLLGCCGAAQAGSVQYYGGDIAGWFGVSAERGGAVNDAWIFDDFAWGGGTVEALFANYLTDTMTISSMEFEIRSGVSAGNGGTLVASGSTTTFTWADIGDAWPGFEIYRGDADVADFALAAGIYHLAVRPVFASYTRAYLGTTIGANSVGGPIANDNSFFNSTYFVANFQDTNAVLLEGTWDFSQGVIGERGGQGHIVPLPTTAGLGAAGLALVGLRRRTRS